LIELQQATVDERFANTDFRADQNYVGQTVSFGNEVVHFVAPKPNTVHLITTILILTCLTDELFWFLDFTGQELIFRLTTLGLRRPRLDTTRSSKISSSKAS